MEVHVPGKPIGSIRDFAFHLLIVTVGILIALSLEELVEWRHHRHLVLEARTNIISEIRDNKKDLDALLTAIPGIRRSQEAILGSIEDVQAHGKSKIGTPQLNSNLAQLSDTSWTTAQTVGALGFMPYEDVKKYAGVYQVQDEYARFQIRTLDAVVDAMTAFSENKNPDKLPPAELEEERTKILESMSALAAQSLIGGELSKAYGEMLSTVSKRGAHTRPTE